MKLFFNSFVLILLLVSSASAVLRDEKIFSQAAVQGHEEQGPKFHITRCPNASAKINNEYILDVAEDIKVRSVMDIFELNFPNGKITRRYKRAFHGFAVSGVTEDEIRLFADGCDNMVVEIFENAKAHNTEIWGLDRIDDKAIPLDNSYLPKVDGTGVSIYIIDSGVKTSHQEFTGRILQGKDFTGEGQVDFFGHGTHVAGTAAGKTYGVAKKATIVPVKVLDKNGVGTWANIIAGIDWVIEQHKKSTTKRSVANLSLGGDKSTAVNSAVKKAADAGVVMVVAAGNDNTDACTMSPASEPTAITVGSSTIVGSITKKDQRSDFSNYGSCLDIFAPGSDIKSADISSNSGTAIMSGTSMASPHVAGAAALLLQSNSTIKASEVVTILKNKATNNVLADAKTGSPNKLLYVGDIVGVSIPSVPTPTPRPPPPPTTTGSGKVNFKVVYDGNREQTQWNLWKKNNATSWSKLADYGPPATGNRNVNRKFSDGYFSFDIHDSYGNGLVAPGLFTITELDSNKVIHTGRTFNWAYSVEFKVVGGKVYKIWSGECDDCLDQKKRKRKQSKSIHLH